MVLGTLVYIIIIIIVIIIIIALLKFLFQLFFIIPVGTDYSTDFCTLKKFYYRWANAFIIDVIFKPTGCILELKIRIKSSYKSNDESKKNCNNLDINNWWIGFTLVDIA